MKQSRKIRQARARLMNRRYGLNLNARAMRCFESWGRAADKTTIHSSNNTWEELGIIAKQVGSTLPITQYHLRNFSQQYPSLDRWTTRTYQSCVRLELRYNSSSLLANSPSLLKLWENK